MKKKHKVIITVLVVVPAAILAGFTFKTLWGWFICPLGVSPITLAHGLGIDLIITFATAKLYLGVVDKDAIFRRWISGIIFNPLMCLAIGWIIHRFMV